MQKPETAGRETPPARLKTRAEFVRTAKGRRLRTPCFSLQMMPVRAWRPSDRRASVSR